MDMPHLNKWTLYMEQPSNDPIRNMGEIKTETVLKRKITSTNSIWSQTKQCLKDENAHRIVTSKSSASLELR